MYQSSLKVYLLLPAMAAHPLLRSLAEKRYGPLELVINTVMLYSNNVCTWFMLLGTVMFCLKTLFTASAALRCGGAALFLVLLWLAIAWAVQLP